jgi:antitoxin YefM
MIDKLVIRVYYEYIFTYMYRIINMQSISYTSARSNLAKTMEQVCDDHAPIAITRKGEGAVVMISMDDYQALEETAYLLRSPKNARRLIDAIAELEEGKGQEKALIE